MIVKKEERRGRDERWMCRGEKISEVNKYKSLGVNLMFGLNINELVWNNNWECDNVGLSAMYRVFRAVLEAFLCYAAQVWGYGHLKRVDGFLRFFF